MDGTVSAQVLAGNGYKVSVADDEPPPDPAVAACADAPTVTVADAEARRGDDHPNLGVNLTKCLSLTRRDYQNIHRPLWYGFTAGYDAEAHGHEARLHCNNNRPQQDRKPQHSACAKPWWINERKMRGYASFAGCSKVRGA